MEISYGKGIFTFTDGQKKCTFNINNGEIINQKTQKQMKRLNFNKQELLDYFRFSAKCDYYNCKSVMDLLYFFMDSRILITDNDVLNTLIATDKIFNLDIRWDGKCSYHYYTNNHDFIESNIKIIAQIAKEEENENREVNLSNILNKIKEKKLVEKYYYYIKDKNFIKTYQEKLNEIEKYIKKEYLGLAIYYYYNQKMYVLEESEYDYQTTKMIIKYIKMCNEMEKTPNKTNNFFREFIETKQSYTLWKETHREEKFKQQYDKIKNKVLFEYGNFQIVLPKESKDLIKEGNEMHHCVGRYIDKVADGDTYIVFVRKKDNLDLPYITAEIRTNGTLGQYFLAYDCYISSKEDIEFRDLYKKYLQEHWVN